MFFGESPLKKREVSRKRPSPADKDIETEQRSSAASPANVSVPADSQLLSNSGASEHKQASLDGKLVSRSSMVTEQPGVKEKSAKSKERKLRKRLRNLAAIKIQRCYRRYADQKQTSNLMEIEMKESAAATIILRFLKNAHGRVTAAPVKSSLLQLKEIQKKVQDLKAEYAHSLVGSPYDQRGRFKYDLLCYEEKLTKIILSMDKVDSHGSDCVRCLRKQIVHSALSLLDGIDAFKQHSVDSTTTSSSSCSESED